MDAHIKHFGRILFCQLLRTGKSFLPTDAANKLAVFLLILSRLDYCNSLLVGIPYKKLNNHIHNHATRLVLCKPMHESATSLLRRLGYNTNLIFSVSYQNSLSPYIFDLLHPYYPSRTLRSLETSLLTNSRFSLETFGKRSFSVFGPTVWSSLPLISQKNTVFLNFRKETHLFEIRLC